jgi:hypothetical protein
MNTYQIKDFAKSITDPRRKQGQRYSLENLLIIILMSILSGCQSLRGIARFSKSNEEELKDVLCLKHGVPNFNTFRDLMLSLDLQIVTTSFISWVASSHDTLSDDFIALDGKAIKSTVTGGNTGLQNFVAVVSAFGHESGIVYGMESYENGKSGETKSLQALVEKLGLKDKVLTLDALHTKKNCCQ